MTRRGLALAGAALVLVLILWLALRPTTPEEQPAEAEHAEESEAPEGFVAITPQQLSSSQIAVQDVQQGSAVELVFPATVGARPTGAARLDARASGVVRSLSKTLGDPVSRGETVARIESGEAAGLAAQLSAARARVTELTAAYGREQRLFSENVTARQDLEAARATLAVAQSELQRAQAAVSAAGVSGDGRSLAVTSPISGRITAAPVVLGAFVNAGDELYRVVNPSALQVEVAIPAADLARIAAGDEATLALPDGREISGRVRSLTPAVDIENRAATAVISLAGQVAGLQPGAFLEARIRPSGEVDGDLVSIPEDAIQTVEGRDVVFRQVPGGFQTQAVTVGTRSAGKATIIAGLKPGTVIATANAFLLKAELGKEGAEDDD
ncbi:metal transporter [Croceibacterium mercuriale]|uniref:Metal transporter n=2 Tax=Croceibacterium mercuriale TaxID=1572751 RepID=A0A0B2BYG0_9SPHN|nr:metal transporter [Croceibacterium mercuriale]